MLSIRFISALLWALSFSTIVLSTTTPEHSSVDLYVKPRNLPGQTDEDTILAIRRRFAAVARRGRFVANSSASIDKSWEDAPLFSYRNILQISCKKCYVKGAASVQVTIDDTNFDPGDVVANVTAQIGEEINNLTATAAKAVGDFIEDFKDDFIKGNLTLDSFKFDNYTIDTDFDIDLPAFPECQLKFTFDGLELYLQLGISFEGTFTIPVFRSQGPMGLSFGDLLEMGVFLEIDLILSADSGVEIESGFHIRFEDGIVFDIALFNKDLSNVVFNGASFEFLPVTVTINNIKLQAVLRVGIRAGISIKTPDFDIPFIPDFLVKAGAGVEVGVFAHVAELLTEISPNPPPPPQIEGNIDIDNCKLGVRQEYTLAIGAAAGATIHVADNTWGPQVATTTPIYYTTLANQCGASSSALPKTVTLAERQNQNNNNNLETTTTTTKVEYTGVQCKEIGRINCPENQQRTIVEQVTLTLTTAVPPGQDVDWDFVAAATGRDVTAQFGSAARQFSATSGAPTSYVPPVETGPPGSEIPGLVDSSGLSTRDKIIIGASVGGGVPILVGLAVGVWCWRRKRRESRELREPGAGYTSGSSGQQQMGYYNNGNKPVGNVTVQQGR